MLFLLADRAREVNCMINCGRCSVDARSKEYHGYSPEGTPSSSKFVRRSQRAVQLKYLRCSDHGVGDDEYGQGRTEARALTLQRQS
jgi:hypothetical protein